MRASPTGTSAAVQIRDPAAHDHGRWLGAVAVCGQREQSVFVRRTDAGRLLAILALASAACTGDGSQEADAPKDPDATTVPSDSLSSACEHFATLWVEFAQTYSGPHGMGDATPDPHGVRATDAANAAFEAAEQGSLEVQRLGAKARGQFEGTVPGDLWTTVTEFLALCGETPPVVECEELTACRSQNLDRG